MKSYLSLIPISAKVHRRQNRMTLLCIIIAVFLVTAVFSMADMEIRNLKNSMINKHGNWHIQLMNLSETDAEQIGSRSDVSAISWYDVINYDRAEDYYINFTKAVLYGVEETYITDIRNCLAEGSFPQNDREVILSPNAKEILGVNIGENVSVNTPFGNMDYTVCGFGSDDAAFNALYDTISIYMERTAFYKVCELDGNKDIAPAHYVRFNDYTNVIGSIADIKTQYELTDERIIENTAVLGLTGFSSNSAVQNFYPIVVALFLVIMLAGVLMISSSMNSNIAQRTKFFGMMRCIGMSKQQIIRFVRLEALNWCKTAVPLGVILGTVITWGLCGVLRFCIGGEFANMPLFGMSAIGIIAGIIVGIVTVLIAASSPAKRAAKVTPMEAVAGNDESTNVHHALKVNFIKIDAALGIHHAVSSKKNLVLMMGSFALSIILFLVFSAGLDFAQALMPSLRSWQPDFTITSEDGSNSVDKNLSAKINEKQGVEHVFGNMVMIDMPVISDGNVHKITLVSYDEYLLACSKDSTIDGDLSKVKGNSEYVLTIYNNSNPLKLGDKIQINGNTVEIAGTLSDGLFSDGITLICSEDTFTRLTGECNYAMLNVQFANNATDENLNEIRNLTGNEYTLSDYRENNQETKVSYWAFRILAYSFLAIISLITVLNIMNSISMSVSARIKQYGTMRAVGMDGWQLTKVVAAEALTYVLYGSVVGCILGLLLHKALYERLVTAYFGDLWHVPIVLLAMVLLLVFVITVIAIYAPVKRIKNMAVTETINEL